jgi:carbonic anhydrase
MKGILYPEMVVEMPTVKTWLNHGELARRVVKENYTNLPEKAALHVITEENVVAQLAHLHTHPSVAARVARGKITLHGWVYHIRTGQIDAWDLQRGRFIPIDQYSLTTAAPRARIMVGAD